MTTVGSEPLKLCRVDALRFPSYNYPYPAFKAKQLRECRDAVTARPVPHFRRVDMTRKRQDFKDFESSIVAAPGTTKREQRGKKGKVHTVPDELPPAVLPFPRPSQALSRTLLNPKEYSRWRFDTTPVVTTEARAEWNRLLNRCPERFDIVLPRDKADCRLHYDNGYAMRYLDPFTTRGIGLESDHDGHRGTKPGPTWPSPYRPITVNHQPI